MKVMRRYIHIEEGRKAENRASLVVQRLNPFALSKMLPFRIRYALVYPLEGDAEVMREVTKVLFNIRNPPLVVINQVEADLPIPLLYAPLIRH